MGKKKQGSEQAENKLLWALFLPKTCSKIKYPLLIRFWEGGDRLRNFTFGYARVSTEGQNLERQIDALEKYGVDYIYNEKITGTKRERPELMKLLERITEGDTIVIESLSRLGRSTKDLIEITEFIQSKGVNLVSLKEAIDTNTSTGKLLFTLMSAIAQFERDVIADRTKEGLKAARARGRMGGRPRIADANVKKAIRLYNTKEYSLKEIEEMTGVKRSTMYRRIKG